VAEIVTPRFTLDVALVALQQRLQRSFRRQHILRLRRWLEFLGAAGAAERQSERRRGGKSQHRAP
jgi:hypothetical protein